MKTISSSGFSLLVLAAFISPNAQAQTQPLTCSIGGGAVPRTVRIGGLTELTGDFELDCVGGTPPALGSGRLPTIDITLTVASAASSGKLTSEPTSGIFTEALLLVNQPNSLFGSSAPLLNCGQTGAPDNGPDGPGICALQASSSTTQYGGIPNGYGDGAVCDGVAGRPAADSFGCGKPNVFQGRLVPGDSIRVIFKSVPFAQPGDNAHLTLHFTNIRVSVPAVRLPAGLLGMVTMGISVQAPFPISIAQPVQRIANIQSGLDGGGTETVVASPIRVREGFSTAFAARNISAGAGDNNGVPGNGRPDNVLRYNGGGSSYPADVAQNIPNLFYFSESGFLWQNNGVNRPPAINPPPGLSLTPSLPLVGGPLGSVGAGGTNTGIDKSGLAKSGTRIAVKFTNIPAGARVEIPPTINLVQANTTTISGVAALTSTDANGAGAYTPRSGFFTAQDSLAVYEMLFADPLVIEDLNIPFILTDAPAGTQLKAIWMLAPFYSTVPANSANADLPKPRFADPSALDACFSIGCLQVTPSQGPNTAPVNVTISTPAHASGVSPLAGAQVKLTGADQPDILGTNTSNTPDMWTLTTTFDLTGAAAAPRDIVVTTSGGTQFSAGTFNITLTAPVLTTPSDLATGAPLAQVLGWSPPGNGISYDVYFGTTNPPAFLGTTTSNSFSPGGLAFNTTYYWQVVSRSGGNSAASVIRSFTTIASGAQPISLEPGTGNAGRQVFTFIARHPTSANNIQYVQFLFSKSGINAANACYVSYDPTGNVFYLLSDDMTTWYGLLGGGSGNTGNSQCTIHAAASSSTKAGTDLTTTIDVSFRTGFAGPKLIYQFSGDTVGPTSGWQTMGTWNDTGNLNVVETISLTPSTGTGTSQTFSAVIRDGNGANTIQFVQFVMNSSLSGFNGCYIHYDRGSNVFFLLNDAGTQFFGLLAGSGQVSNSQCTLTGSGSGGVVSGNDLTIHYNLAFSPAFTGLKKAYIQSIGSGFVIENWKQVGTWTR